MPLVFTDLGEVSVSADPLDLLTLSEAKAALNIQSSDGTQDAELASYITAVSRRLDDLCGAIVKRTVTDEEYVGGTGRIFLRQAPVSRSAATTITSVTEYSSGTAQALTAEALGTSTAYDFTFDPISGVITRRSTWSDSTFGSQRVVVTYSAGRYASTAAVDAKFKIAAARFLQHVWQSSQGVGGSATFGPQEAAGLPGFAVPNFVVEMLADELQPPAMA